MYFVAAAGLLRGRRRAGPRRARPAARVLRAAREVVDPLVREDGVEGAPNPVAREAPGPGVGGARGPHDLGRAWPVDGIESRRARGREAPGDAAAGSGVPAPAASPSGDGKRPPGTSADEPLTLLPSYVHEPLTPLPSQVREHRSRARSCSSSGAGPCQIP